MSDFLDDSYEAPSGGNYMTLEDGVNRFRFLSKPITGWEGWQNSKPTRNRTKEEFNGFDFDDAWGEPGYAKHFWAMKVWNYQTSKVEVLEIDKMSIIKVLEAHARSADWGSPLDSSDSPGYDFEVTKTGVKKDTEYQTKAIPPKAMLPEIAQASLDTQVNIEVLFDGGDPFEVETLNDSEKEPLF